MSGSRAQRAWTGGDAPATAGATRGSVCAGLGAALAVVWGLGTLLPVPSQAASLAAGARGGYTVQERVAQYRDPVHRRLVPYFREAGVAYPPAAVVLVGIKRSRRLELYAGPSRDALRYIRSYPVMAASGAPGPKLREGDEQVPEGIYPVTRLNPNSRFHLSLKLGYPNRFDRWMASLDGRHDLGGDIFIHGGYASTGCLAMGDRVAEDLFVLAAESGVGNVMAILTPVDLRQTPPPRLSDAEPVWTPWLYDVLESVLNDLAPAYSPARRADAVEASSLGDPWQVAGSDAPGPREPKPAVSGRLDDSRTPQPSRLMSGRR